MPLIRKPANPDLPASRAPSIDVSAGLASSDREQRWAAARAAANIPASASALASALRVESDSRVREAMFTSLAHINSGESVESLLGFLRSDDAALRRGAMDALRSMVEVIRAHLPGLLNDDDADVRLLSCDLARSLPSEEATPMLSQLLAREREANVCAAAIDVLAEAGRPEALNALADCESRFSDEPFLTFAIRVARQRILSQSNNKHG